MHDLSEKLLDSDKPEGENSNNMSRFNPIVFFQNLFRRASREEEGEQAAETLLERAEGGRGDEEEDEIEVLDLRPKEDNEPRRRCLEVIITPFQRLFRRPQKPDESLEEALIPFAEAREGEDQYAIKVGFDEEALRCAGIDIDGLERLTHRSLSGYIRRSLALDLVIEKSLTALFLNREGIGSEIKPKKCLAHVRDYTASRIWPKSRSLVFRDKAIIRRAVGVANYFEGTLLFTGKTWSALLLSLLVNDFYNYVAFPDQRYGNTPLKILLAQSSNQLTLTQSLTNIYIWPLLLVVPSVWGITRAILGSYRIGQLDAEKIEELVGELKTYESSLWHDLGRWFLPLNRTQRNIGMAEQLLMWDGRLSPEIRQELLQALLTLESTSKKWTWVRVQRALANIADGVAIRDFQRLREAGVTQEALLSVLSVKVAAFEGILQRAQSPEKSRLKRLWAWVKTPFSKLFASYQAWCIGRPTALWSQPLFWAITAFEFYIRLRLFYTIYQGLQDIFEAWQCESQGKVWRYMDRVAEYQCSVCGDFTVFYKDAFTGQGCLEDFLRRSQPVDEVVRLIRRVGFYGIKVLDLSYQNITAQFLQKVLPVLAQQAKQLETLKLSNTMPLQTLPIDASNVLSQYIQSLNMTVLDLSGQSIGDAGLQLLAPQFAGTKIKTLILDNNNIGQAGMTALAAVLSQSSIQVLSLRQNQLDDQAVTALAAVLPQTFLETLDLGENTVGNIGIGALAQQLPASYLRSLSLRGNVMDGGGIYHLSKALPYTLISSLDLGNSHLGNGGMVLLSPALSATNLQELQIDDNQAGNAGMYLLTRSISHSRIRRLNLMNNLLGFQGIQTLAEALPNSDLEALSLSGFYQGTQALATLAKVLPHTYTDSIDFSRVSIGDIGIRYLVFALRYMKIKHLNLFRNNITIEGIRILVPILKNSYIVSLNLGGNIIGDEGVKILASVLPQMPFLESLELMGMKLTAQGVHLIINAVRHTKVIYLGLQSNNFGVESARALAAGLNQTDIESLQLGWNWLGNEGVQLIAEKLSETKIKTLMLRANLIDEEGAKLLAAGAAGSCLKSLNINSNSKIGDAGLMALLPIVQQNAMTELYLGDIGLTQEGIQALSSVLNSTQLTLLDLQYNIFDNERMKILTQGLRGSKVTFLNFYHCGMTDNGLAVLSNILSEIPLSTLLLTNNPFTELGIEKLASALAGSQIITLNLISAKKANEPELGDKIMLALAPGLKGSQVQTLQLDSLGFGRLGAKAVANIFSQSSLTSISFAGNYFGEEGISAIANALKTSQLRSLDVGWTSLSVTGVQALSAVLGDSILTELYLDGNHLSDQAAKILAESLPGSQLEFLNLFHNQVTDLGAKWLAEKIRHSKLRQLWINSNFIYIEGLNALINSFFYSGVQNFALRIDYFKKMQSIYNRNWDDGEAAVVMLCSRLYFSGIQSLVLTINPSMKKPGLAGLLASILNGSTVRALSLPGMRIGAKGLEQLLPFLKQSHVEKLNLGGNELFSESAALMPALLEMPHLKALDLAYCGIRQEAIKALASALPGSNLTELILASNSIKEEGLIALSSALPHSLLSSINLGSIYATDVGYNALFSKLRDSHITSLNLDQDYIRGDRLKQLVKAINGTKMEVLSLWANFMDDNDMALLSSYLGMNPLKELNLLVTRITDHGMELLTAVLPKSQLRKLSLSSSGISRTGWQMFLDVLNSTDISSVYNPGFLSLKSFAPILENKKVTDLSFAMPNNPKREEMVAFSNALKTSALKTFQVSHVFKLTDDDFELLFGGVGESSLSSLSLGGSQPVSDYQAEILASSISNSSIVDVSLFGLQFSGAGFRTMMSALGASQIRQLTLFKISPMAQQTNIIADMLRNSTIEALNLNNNHLTDDQFSPILEVLPYTRLHSINIGNNELTSTVLLRIAERLPITHATDVNFVSHMITFPEYQEDAAIEMLAEGISRSKLQKFDFKYNFIGQQGLEGLGTYLPLSKLREINLGGNIFNVTDFSILTPIMRMPTLETFSLDYSQIGERGVQAVAQALSSSSIKYLSLQGAQAEDKDLAILVQQLPASKVKEVHLSINVFRNNSRVAFEAILKDKRCHLTTLDLSAMGLNSEDLTAIVKQLPGSPIQVLKAGYNFIQDPGLLTLAGELVKDIPFVDKPIIWIKQLNQDQRRALAQAKPNTNLMTLDLSYNQLGDAGAKAVCRVLPGTDIAMDDLILEGNTDITQVNIYTCSAANSRLEPPLILRWIPQVYRMVTGLFCLDDDVSVKETSLVSQGYFAEEELLGHTIEITGEESSMPTSFSTDSPIIYVFMNLVNSLHQWTTGGVASTTTSKALTTFFQSQETRTEKPSLSIAVPEIIPTIMLGVTLWVVIKNMLQSLWNWWTKPAPIYVDQAVFNRQMKLFEKKLKQFNGQLQTALQFVKSYLSGEEQSEKLFELKMLEHALEEHGYSLEDVSDNGKATQEELEELRLDFEAFEEDYEDWLQEGAIFDNAIKMTADAQQPVRFFSYPPTIMDSSALLLLNQSANREALPSASMRLALR